MGGVRPGIGGCDFLERVNSQLVRDGALSVRATGKQPTAPHSRPRRLAAKFRRFQAVLLNLPATQPVRELVTKLITGFR